MKVQAVDWTNYSSLWLSNRKQADTKSLALKYNTLRKSFINLTLYSRVVTMRTICFTNR
jgi:hypothetical protein